MGRELAGRVVAVTGAASGIGRALARRFAAQGARVALLDRDAGGAEAAAKEIEAAGGEALARTCDVTDPDACAAAIGATLERFGGLDILVNNAGLSQRGSLLDTDLAVFRRVMDVNFFGALHCTKAALPALLESRGLVVAISSVAGFAPLLGRSGYCASKHALHGLFDTLRCELAPRGVEVLLVCPGFTATGIEKSALGSDGGPAARPQSRVGGVATPEAVAAAVVDAVRRRRRLLVLSRVGRLSRLLTRLSPRLYERLMERGLRAELEGSSGAERF